MPIAHAVSVASSREHYDVLVGRGLLAEIGPTLKTRLPTLRRKCAIITDANLASGHAATVCASLTASGYEPVVVEVAAGESSKTLGAAEGICERLVAHGLDRQSFVVALGGGVVGDVGGFVAAIYHRGIPVVQVPTTIVAQVDSSLGGKTGVNAAGGKNLLGAFHPPSLVVADVATLDTLPDREFRQGFAEIVKHGAIADRAMLNSLPGFLRGQDITALIRRNIEIKSAIVTADEFETTGGRATLNFGHTLGHAVEAVAGFGRFRHGEAVSVGLAVALQLSVTKAGLSEADRRLVVSCLEHFQLPVRIPADLATDHLIAAMRRDKKFQAGAIRFILTRGLGSAYMASDVTEPEIAGAIDALR